MVFDLILFKSAGGYTDTTAPDMVKAKETAKKYLSKDPQGSVMVVDPFGKKTVTIYYIDTLTKGFKDARNDRIIIAHNDAYPHTSAQTVVEARITACELMHKERWSSVGIFSVIGKDKFMDCLGYIRTNGYRYEYSDFKKGKGYTLSPTTGRISKY